MEYVKIFSAVPMLMPMLTTESLDDGKVRGFCFKECPFWIIRMQGMLMESNGSPNVTLH